MIQKIVHLFLVRPLVFLGLGLNVRRRHLLPETGPGIIIANHNSHLDTLVLMSLFPLGRLSLIRPVAAADYFMKTRLRAWLATRLMGIIPIDRNHPTGDPLAPIVEALDRGSIVVLFPEGSRGEPEVMDRFKTGIAHLARKRPEIPVVPVYLHGLGKALPRGDFVLVPFFCDIFVGSPVPYVTDRSRYMSSLREAMNSLATEGEFPEWL